MTTIRISEFALWMWSELVVVAVDVLLDSFIVGGGQQTLHDVTL